MRITGSMRLRVFVWKTAVWLTLLGLSRWAAHTALGQGVPAGPAGTSVCGPITADTTWTEAGSPYVVCGTYPPVVSEGVTLTVEPGVEVLFDPKGRLTVQGMLTAIGTAP
jgi:hypothetical protein